MTTSIKKWMNRERTGSTFVINKNMEKYELEIHFENARNSNNSNFAPCIFRSLCEIITARFKAALCLLGK